VAASHGACCILQIIIAAIGVVIATSLSAYPEAGVASRPSRTVVDPL
jgi:hypothetical protein